MTSCISRSQYNHITIAITYQHSYLYNPFLKNLSHLSLTEIENINDSQTADAIQKQKY